MDFPFKRLVIWGLRDVQHTHRYIHLGFFSTAQKLGIPVLWVENLASNREAIRAGDLVISVNVAGDKLPIVRGAKYVLHNFKGSFDHMLDQLGEDCVQLQVFTNATAKGAEEIGTCTYINRSTRTLIQPWGTNLLRHEFLPPPKTRLKYFVFWIGSVWNNQLDQGNVNEYAAMKRALWRNHKLLFRPKVSDAWAARLVRRSVISPAIAARWQVENGYLPCRMFKNVSYGQLGTTNVMEFEKILGSALISSTDIDRLVDGDLSIKDTDRADMIREQQKLIANHTYEDKLRYMLQAFEMLGRS